MLNTACIKVVMQSGLSATRCSVSCRPRLAQVCTGPGDVSQHESFVPPCPITFRMNVIPTGYNVQHEADSSHDVIVGKAESRMSNVLTWRDLWKRKSFGESANKYLR